MSPPIYVVIWHVGVYRLDEDELCRFYSASNFEFSRLLSSVKKTILWRQTYTILSPKELEAWSHWIFWHGCDTRQRPCLIIRLGLACSSLKSNKKPILARAVGMHFSCAIMELDYVDHFKGVLDSNIYTSISFSYSGLWLEFEFFSYVLRFVYIYI